MWQDEIYIYILLIWTKTVRFLRCITIHFRSVCMCSWVNIILMMILKRNRLFGTTRKKWFIIQQLFFYCQATIFLLSNSFRLLSFRLYLSISLSLWFHYHCYTWSLLIKPHIYILCVCVCAMSFRVALMCLSLECLN